MTHSVYRFGEELRSEDVRDFADLQIFGFWQIWVFADVRDLADLDRISDEGISGFGRSEKTAEILTVD